MYNPPESDRLNKVTFPPYTHGSPFPPSSEPYQTSCQPSFQSPGHPPWQPSFQPPGQPSFQSPGQPPWQPSFQPPGQRPIQPHAQPSFQSPGQPPWQPSFQPPGQRPIQPHAQPSFQSPGQPPWQPSFQPPGQPPTQPHAQPSFQSPGQSEGYPEAGNEDLVPYSDDAPPIVPSAPMEPPPGYSNVGFIDGCISPPPKYDIDKYLPKQRPEIKRASVITDEEAKSALLVLCKSHCCWGSKAAREMNILTMKTTNAFHYFLETFCEKRTTMWVSTPYMGQILDGPQNGYPPMPWDVPVPFTEMFKSGSNSVEIPHTACMKGCDRCRAKGYLRCNRCHGFGWSRCTFCHGSGHRSVDHVDHFSAVHSNFRETCFTCRGSGWKRCHSCSGSGRIRCETCLGNSFMKCYIQLTVQWTNYVEHHVTDETDMPNELVKEVSGDIGFREENVRVFPIVHCPEPKINKASADLIAKHASAFPNEKILFQKQTVKLVPVTETKAQWKNSEFRFFVYGLERKVFTENYPQTKCCGCSIL